MYGVYLILRERVCAVLCPPSLCLVFVFEGALCGYVWFFEIYNRYNRHEDDIYIMLIIIKLKLYLLYIRDVREIIFVVMVMWWICDM